MHDHIVALSDSDEDGRSVVVVDRDEIGADNLQDVAVYGENERGGEGSINETQ